MMICPKCKTENEEDSLFCGECGEKLEKETVCPNCGEKIPLNEKFCMECGTRAADIRQTGASVRGNADGSFDTANINPFIEIEECQICHKIGSRASGSFHKCPKCGRYYCSEHYGVKYDLCYDCSKKMREKDGRATADGKAVYRIGKWAFSGCPNLTVYFDGTKREWKKLYPKNDVKVKCSKRSLF